MQIGFLLNHEGAHQVGHVLPIALAMAKLGPEIALKIFVAPGVAEAEARRQAGRVDGRLSIVPLDGAGWLGRAVSAVTGDAIPAKRISILRRNRDLFAGLDALVVPEKTSLLLKTKFGLTDLPLIHTRHGAGDRAVGFDPASGRFDLVLLSGEKIKDRLARAGLLKNDGYAIVGYPKFDQLSTKRPEHLFDNGRPTVMYNPHPSPALSSWYRMGPAVLDFFAEQREFNLVFAPHVMLFAKRYQLSVSPLGVARVPQVPEHIAKLPHIHVDLGSAASVDMTYTLAADIYLGDASSQVYEFLARPRPCVFLNPLGLDWQGDPNFTHWRAGSVVENIAGLEHALEMARVRHAGYRETQEQLFSYSFELKSELSSHRAAKAIIDWLVRRKSQ